MKQEPLKKTTYLEAVAAAIKHEKDSFEYYLKTSESLPVGPIRELFLQLAEDGDEHIATIKEIYKKAEGKVLPNLKQLSEIYKFHNTTIQKLMNKLERNMNETLSKVEHEALERAIQVNEDAKEFYGKIKGKFNDPKINLLFDQLHRMVESNLSLLEAQSMNFQQSFKQKVQFFWDDMVLLEEAAKDVGKKSKLLKSFTTPEKKTAKPSPKKEAKATAKKVSPSKKSKPKKSSKKK